MANVEADDDAASLPSSGRADVDDGSQLQLHHSDESRDLGRQDQGQHSPDLHPEDDVAPVPVDVYAEHQQPQAAHNSMTSIPPHVPVHDIGNREAGVQISQSGVHDCPGEPVLGADLAAQSRSQNNACGKSEASHPSQSHASSAFPRTVEPPIQHAPQAASHAAVHRKSVNVRNGNGAGERGGNGNGTDAESIGPLSAIAPVDNEWPSRMLPAEELLGQQQPPTGVDHNDGQSERQRHREARRARRREQRNFERAGRQSWEQPRQRQRTQPSGNMDLQHLNPFNNGYQFYPDGRGSPPESAPAPPPIRQPTDPKELGQLPDDTVLGRIQGLASLAVKTLVGEEDPRLARADPIVKRAARKSTGPLARERLRKHYLRKYGRLPSREDEEDFFTRGAGADFAQLSESQSDGTDFEDDFAAEWGGGGGAGGPQTSKSKSSGPLSSREQQVYDEHHDHRDRGVPAGQNGEYTIPWNRRHNRVVNVKGPSGSTNPMSNLGKRIKAEKTKKRAEERERKNGDLFSTRWLPQGIKKRVGFNIDGAVVYSGSEGGSSDRDIFDDSDE